MQAAKSLHLSNFLYFTSASSWIKLGALQLLYPKEQTYRKKPTLFEICTNIEYPEIFHNYGFWGRMCTDHKKEAAHVLNLLKDIKNAEVDKLSGLFANISGRKKTWECAYRKRAVNLEVNLYCNPEDYEQAELNDEAALTSFANLISVVHFVFNHVQSQVFSCDHLICTFNSDAKKFLGTPANIKTKSKNYIKNIKTGNLDKNDKQIEAKQLEPRLKNIMNVYHCLNTAPSKNTPEEDRLYLNIRRWVHFMCVDAKEDEHENRLQIVLQVRQMLSIEQDKVFRSISAKLKTCLAQ